RLLRDFICAINADDPFGSRASGRWWRRRRDHFHRRRNWLLRFRNAKVGCYGGNRVLSDLLIQRIAQNELNLPTLHRKDEFLGLILSDEQCSDGRFRRVARVDPRKRLKLL